MKVLKMISTIILSFILMIVMMIVTGVFILNNYIDKENINKKLENINFYSQLENEVKEGFKDYVYQSGLEENIFDDLYNEENAKNDVLLIIDSIYFGNELEIDSSEIKSKLDNKINDYISTQSRKLSNQEKENIAKFEDLIISSYEENFSIYKKMGLKIGDKFINSIDLINKIKLISIISAIVLLLIIVLINIKTINAGVGFISVALMSSGTLLILTRNLVIKNINIDNIVFFKQSFSNIIILILKDVLNMIYEFGIWYILVGVFLTFISSIMILPNNFEEKNNKNDKKVMEENIG